jgi:hypothetical protein
MAGEGNLGAAESARHLGVSPALPGLLARSTWSASLRARVERLEATAAGARAHVLTLTAKRRSLVDERAAAQRNFERFDRGSQAALQPFLADVDEELTRLNGQIEAATAAWNARAIVLERVLAHLADAGAPVAVLSDGSPRRQGPIL